MFQRIFFFLLFFLILTDLYIYQLHIRKPARKSWQRIAYFMPSVLLLAALITLYFKDNFGENENYAIGIFVIVYMAITIPKGLYMICSLIGLAFRRVWKKSSFVGNIIGLVIGLGGMLMIIYGTVSGWHKYQVKEVTFQSADLPEAFNGYKIVQFSDLHIGTIAKYKKQVQRLVNIINEQKGDLIVFTGDLVNHRASELNGVEHILGQLHAPNGVYSVLGNHDYSPYYKWESPQKQMANLDELKQKEVQMGWTLLNNAHTLIQREDTCIALVGVENQGLPPFPEKGDLPKAVKGTEGLFKVLLSHDPTHWRREILPDTDIQLTLSGHTHAMQFILFGFTPASWFFKENRGMYYENDRALYVNIGAGEVMLPFRFGAWPEITVITLQKK